MTKEEAILTLCANVMVACERASFDSATCNLVEEAIEMAIEALERTSNAHPTHECVEPTHECVDLISRNKVLNLVLDVCNDVMDECETVTGICGEEVYTDVREVDAILKCNKRIRNGIRRLPSAEPKTGEWIEDAETFYKAVNEYGGGVDENTPYFTDDIACSKCLAKFSVIDNETERFDFCPNCGANMRGGDQ